MSEMETSQVAAATPQTEASSTSAASPAVGGSSPAQQASSPQAGSKEVAAQAPDQPAQPAQPAYTPNFKFKYPKVDSTQEEREFDDWVKSFVNEKNETQFRDLYTKAYGMDFFKEKYSKVNDQLKGYKEKYEPLVQTWGELSQAYQKGDYDTFFKGLKISDQVLFHYVNDKLKEMEMPHEQRMEKEQQREAMRELEMLRRQNMELQSRSQTEMTQVREFQLQSTLSKPEITSIAKSFDERVGKPGAFRDEVVKRGILAWHTTGQDISPEQAVQEVLQVLGNPHQNAGMQTVAATPGLTTQVNGAQKAAPPVIPNVGARGGSPTKRAPTSLADLKKMAEQM